MTEVSNVEFSIHTISNGKIYCVDNDNILIYDFFTKKLICEFAAPVEIEKIKMDNDIIGILSKKVIHVYQLVT